MQRLDPETIDYYDHEVVRMINEKYGIDPMTALERCHPGYAEPDSKGIYYQVFLSPIKFILS